VLETVRVDGAAQARSGSADTTQGGAAVFPKDPPEGFAACAAPTQTSSWADDVRAACAHLGWPAPRLDAARTTRAFTAPYDQLFAATEVNEWAWQRDCGVSAQLHAPGFAPLDDDDAALRCFAALARAERRPDLMALLDAAVARGVPAYVDDARLSLGDGEASRNWKIEALPSVDDVDWSVLRRIPKALVTGSNGKTTTVRLLAAMLREQALHTGHSCTDGLFVDGARLDAGDYSGPVGARTLLRHGCVQAAVLETARGGLLRRGLAVRDADVAVVTNVSADHFGEYGIHTLDDLADAKRVVAKGLRAGGRLVLNADDEVLRRRGAPDAVAVAWFALDFDHPQLQAARARGESTCGGRDGVLLLGSGTATPAGLGRIDALPLTLGGLATYNIANLAGAALAADGLGIPVATIAGVFARFGDAPADNPGRLQRWTLGGATVLLDYAHNPEGLDGFLRVATALRGGAGRLGLLLGQAGNRPDDDIRALARVAAGFEPARVVLKDIDGFLRGRRPGEVADLIEAELSRAGLPAAATTRLLRETDAARLLLEWLRDGDVLALPIHAPAARDAVVALLDRLQAAQWRPGLALPAAEVVVVAAPADNAGAGSVDIAGAMANDKVPLSGNGNGNAAGIDAGQARNVAT
jgi:UDP-N-acetylmuramyl tripeptide synthase